MIVVYDIISRGVSLDPTSLGSTSILILSENTLMTSTVVNQFKLLIDFENLEEGKYYKRVANDLERGLVIGQLLEKFENTNLFSQRPDVLKKYLPKCEVSLLEIEKEDLNPNSHPQFYREDNYAFSVHTEMFEPEPDFSSENHEIPKDQNHRDQNFRVQKPRDQKSSDHFTEIYKDVLDKYAERFLQFPEIRAAKSRSAKAQILNIADGSIISIKKKFPLDKFPSSQEISDLIYEDLLAHECMIETGISVEYLDDEISLYFGRGKQKEFICGLSNQQKPPKAHEVPKNEKPRDQSRDHFTEIYKDVIEKYTERYLLFPEIRATKSRSAKAQILNIVDGSIISIKKKFPLDKFPSSKEISDLIYEDLLAHECIIETGLSVEYLDDEISLYFGRGKQKEFICGLSNQQKPPKAHEIPEDQKPRVQKSRDHFSEIYEDVLEKYTERFLQLPEIRASKSRSAKAQILNIADGCIISIRKKYPSDKLPSSKEISDLIYDDLIDNECIIETGLSVKYLDDSISLYFGRGNRIDFIRGSPNQRHLRLISSIFTTLCRSLYVYSVNILHTKDKPRNLGVLTKGMSDLLQQETEKLKLVNLYIPNEVERSVLISMTLEDMIRNKEMNISADGDVKSIIMNYSFFGYMDIQSSKNLDPNTFNSYSPNVDRLVYSSSYSQPDSKLK